MGARKAAAWILALFLTVTLSTLTVGAEESACYVSTVYNEENGLPTSEANAVLQTSDGYLWIGSYGGLIRYDGSTFRNFSLENALESSSIRSLFQDSAGRLWIGSNDAGVFCYENGLFTHIPCTKEHSFLCIRDFAEGTDGAVYVATNSGVAVIRDGVMTPCASGVVAGETVYSLGVDRFGRLWGAMNGGKCAVFRKDRLVDVVNSLLIFPGGEEIYCLTSDDRGNLYFGTDGTALARVTFFREDMERSALTVTSYETKNTVTHNRLSIARDGSILVSGQRGFAWLLPDGTLREFEERDHASALSCAVMDYEGNLWAASTNEGLVRYSLGCYSTHNQDSGLSELAVNAVTQSGGLYYVASDQGLRAFDRNWQPVENSLTNRLSAVRVRHVVGDSRGRLWCATYSDDGVVCYDPTDDHIQCFNEENGLNGNWGRVLLELSDGSMAVGTQNGLAVIRDGAVVRHYGRQEGFDTLVILCLLESEDGTILAGSDGSGIYAIKDDSVTVHSFTEGLEEGVVLRILADRENEGYFVSAGSSLYYWSEGAFRKLDNLRVGAGSIFDLYDREGKLWLLQNSGILSVDKEKLLSGAEARTVLYGMEHGLTGSLNANTWNYLSPEGTLYVTTRNGISEFFFRGVERPLPTIVINSVKVDDRVYELPQQVEVESGAQRVTLDFAALSFSGGGSLSLAYWLEGFDGKEIILDGTASGSISYTNLPGGDYVFHLRVFDPEKPGREHTDQIAIHKIKSPMEQPVFQVVFLLTIGLAAGGCVLLYSRNKWRRLRHRQREYQEIVEQSLRTFANTIDAKDPYTNGHSARVAWYSREIARRMGLPEQEQERIYYVAMLHDIGKIGVPDSILNKQGNLTEEERKVIQRHTVVGGDILKDFTALEGIEEGARYHHERYDGKGYCDGKAGKEIPLMARIIGVADSYDAMSSDRCYRKALPQEVVAQELRKGSGTQFDPEIVPIMLEMIEDGTAPVKLHEEEEKRRA